MPSNCAPVKGLPTMVVIAARGKIMPLTGKHKRRMAVPE
jgi:hypothetical protein